MDAADDVRTCQHEHVAVALQVVRMRRKPFAAKVFLLQLVPLDHRPHRAVQNQDALCEQFVELLRDVHHFSSSCRSPLAINTVNGSFSRRAPTRTTVFSKPAAFMSAASCASLKTEPPIAELAPDPAFVVLTKIEHEQPAAGAQNPVCLRQRALGVVRVVERLGEQRNVDRLVCDRQLFEIAALPRDVPELAAIGQRLAAREHVFRTVDGDHAPGPSRRLERQIAFTASEVGHVQGRHQQSKRPRPRAQLRPGTAAGVRRPTTHARRNSPCAAAVPPPAVHRRRAFPAWSA
jgi:hypothetical protein